MNKKTLTAPPVRNFKKLIIDEIIKNGGWVNCHAHIDRAYTVTAKNLHLYSATIKQKWDLNDALKKNSTVNDYYDRMARAIELMLTQNVRAIGTFIDVDEVVKDKAINAAIKIRDKYKKDITIKYINQVHYGVLSKNARKWFDIGAEFVDIIGGLPSRDTGREAEHLDVLLQTAKSMKKMVHAHVDQLNSAKEKETELLAKKTIEHKMNGKVVGIHGISISAQPINYRKRLYTLIKKANLMMVTCPWAFIDSRRNEEIAPTHNSILPVDEMIPKKIIVGMGVDNISDIYVPFGEGRLDSELQLLMAACRILDKNVLVKIATVNGRKILGI